MMQEMTSFQTLWSQYGLLGLVILLVLKHLFDIVRDVVKSNLKTKDSGESQIAKIHCSSSDCPIGKTLADIVEKLEELAKKIDVADSRLSNLDEMHRKFDNDGSPKWFVKESLMHNAQKAADGTNKISRDLEEYMRNQGSVMKTLSGHLETLNSLLKKITGG